MYHINNNPGTSTYANILKGSNNVNNAVNVDLFSNNELIKIFNEMLVKLKICKTKEEQFSVLAELTIKHLYNVSP